MLEWFDGYFKLNKIDFPNIYQTQRFYRSGVSGIEYLGMIRKMAAINFYIRGLNPANIEQGDSLAKYSPVTDHESKSVIIANPPFGAQRDQESYPDIWQEHSKESETTILLVKLMFETLRQGGRCSVIVSEGFHTWDQLPNKCLKPNPRLRISKRIYKGSDLRFRRWLIPFAHRKTELLLFKI